MKVLNLLHQESRNSKGFSLIEIVLSIGFIGMLLTLMFSMLRLTEKSSILLHDRDDLMLNGRYATEYIIEDVELADEVVDMDDYCPLNIEKESTLGFILINHNRIEGFEYQYIYYRLSGDTLIRTTYNNNTYKPDNPPGNGGNNNVVHNVSSLNDSGYCSKDQLLLVNISMESSRNGGERSFMESKYLGNR